MNQTAEPSFQSVAPRDPRRRPEHVPVGPPDPTPAEYRPDDDQNDDRLKRRGWRPEDAEQDEDPARQPDR